jgi:hypothetical protein
MHRNRGSALRLSALVALVATAAALAGCATPVHNYVPRSVDVSDPPVGTINVAMLGDQIVVQGRYREHDALLVKEDASVGLLNPYKLRHGYYLKQGEDLDAGFYLPSRKEGGQILRNPLADPAKIVQAYKMQPTLCVVTIFDAAACNDSAKFEFTRQPAESVDSFQQALVYLGRSGERIRIGYREFSNDPARPTFAEETEDKPDELQTVTYKTARIEVIEATDAYLKYRVLKKFDRATQ